MNDPEKNDFENEVTKMKEVESQRTKELMQKFFGLDSNDLQEFEFEKVKYSLQKDNQNYVLKFKDKQITFSENGEGQEFFVSDHKNQKTNVIRELKVYDHKAINDTLSKYIAQK